MNFLPCYIVENNENIKEKYITFLSSNMIFANLSCENLEKFIFSFISLMRGKGFFIIDLPEKEEKIEKEIVYDDTAHSYYICDVDKFELKLIFEKNKKELFTTPIVFGIASNDDYFEFSVLQFNRLIIYTDRLKEIELLFKKMNISNEGTYKEVMEFTNNVYTIFNKDYFKKLMNNLKKDKLIYVGEKQNVGN